MSRVVKSIGRGIKKIVSGIGKLIKKVVKSPIGKLIATAGLVYFGGAALSGGIGGATSTAAGSSFLSGASAGLSSAAGGISNAWSSLLGGNFSTAGSQLVSGFTDAGAAGAAGSAGLDAASGLYSAANVAPTTFGESTLGAWPGASDYTLSTTGIGDVGLGAPSATGLVNSPNFMTYADGAQVGSSLAAPAAQQSASIFQRIMENKYAMPALITAGSQLAGGLISSYGASQQQKYQEKLEQDKRDRLNANIGYNAGWKTY